MATALSSFKSNVINNKNNNIQNQNQQLLPDKILVGYVTNHCKDLDDMTEVTKAVEDGVNVLIWSFIKIRAVEDNDYDNNEDDNELEEDERRKLNLCRITTAKDSKDNDDDDGDDDYKQAELRLEVEISQDLDNYKKYRQQLISMGYDSSKIKHLVAFGGWNGPHFPPGFSGSELYDAFKAANVLYTPTTSTNSGSSGCTNASGSRIGNDGNKERSTINGLELLWDGIDWDLEGHDRLDHPNNEFTKELLDQVGEFSQRAKDDGLIVSMAPPESYLDTTSARFSRFVNLTYPEDAWYLDFSYHGWNVYAYILAQYGDCIDFIFIQFYESYSHALYQTEMNNMSQSDFLIQYIDTLAKKGFGYEVHFEDDPTVNLKNQFVEMPLSKIVFGFANGWAVNSKKAIFFSSSQIRIAYNHLARVNLAPRGFGYWVVEEEGKNGIYLTKDLNDILSGVVQ